MKDTSGHSYDSTRPHGGQVLPNPWLLVQRLFSIVHIAAKMSKALEIRAGDSRRIESAGGVDLCDRAFLKGPDG